MFPQCRRKYTFVRSRKPLAQSSSFIRRGLASWCVFPSSCFVGDERLVAEMFQAVVDMWSRSAFVFSRAAICCSIISNQIRCIGKDCDHLIIWPFLLKWSWQRTIIQALSGFMLYLDHKWIANHNGNLLSCTQQIYDLLSNTNCIITPVLMWKSSARINNTFYCNLTYVWEKMRESMRKCGEGLEFISLKMIGS